MGGGLPLLPSLEQQLQRGAPVRSPTVMCVSLNVFYNIKYLPVHSAYISKHMQRAVRERRMGGGEKRKEGKGDDSHFKTSDAGLLLLLL